MKTFKSSSLLLAVAASAALALDGCSSSAENPAGSENPPAEKQIQVPEASKILPQTAEVIKNATSVSMSGEITQEGQIIKVDLAGTNDGSNSKAAVSLDAGKEAAGMIDSLVGDKWISTSNASQFGDFNVGAMLKTMTSGDFEGSDSGKFTGSSLEDLAGVKAFKYTGDENAYWIAAEGEPYLLQVEGSDAKGSGSGNMSFSDWNAVSPFKAPADSETVSIPGL
ncbi:hypothetical protein [Paeniglutamicibacter antarcticus]|uniref:Lipoprotein n=1 Tax=Paeniglutamicibacter antarcticus TaxID=494023 RepID=A0ABP9TPW2_9MICC